MTAEIPPSLEKVHRFLDEAGDTTFFGKGRVPILGQNGVSLCFGLGMVKFAAPVTEVRAQVEALCRAVQTDAYLNRIPPQPFAVLFDSGARAEEFHNIRFEDIYLPEGKENFVRIALKQEYSKTLGRTIALYWRFSLDAVKEYLSERIATGIKPSDPVFDGTYDATKKFLQRFGQSVLKRPIHYHLFRHSSTTHYATKLNRQELCYRYGWKFSSNMPDIYISRAGMETKQLDEKFTQTELSTLKDDLAKLEQASKIKDVRIEQLERAIQTISANFDTVANVLSLKPALEEVHTALRRNPRHLIGEHPA
jgi:hypothetical protein